jgi:hypothetical protein
MSQCLRSVLVGRKKGEKGEGKHSHPERYAQRLIRLRIARPTCTYVRVGRVEDGWTAVEQKPKLGDLPYLEYLEYLEYL